MLCRDNITTKDSSKTFIFEDLRWDIVLSDNYDILSQYFFFINIGKTIHIAIFNFQCFGITPITIPTKNLPYVSSRHERPLECERLIEHDLWLYQN